MDHIDKDEELVCPLCGGRVLWMPVSRIYVCEHCKQSYSEVNGVYLRKERKATAEKPSAGGDAAKLREAIDKCVNLITEFGNAEIVKTPLDVIIDIEAILKAALAEPVRNCEVGTPEEQDARFESFCDAHKCFSCPAKTLRPFLSTCALKWAQMPYEEKEGVVK